MGVVDGGLAGTCIAFGEHCDAGAAQAFCEHRRQCQDAMDASAATCCYTAGTYQCGLGPCPGTEACQPGAIPSECTDVAKSCMPFGISGYSLCE
jgi:hypothetical protein